MRRQRCCNAQTAITYPWTTLTDLSGETIKIILEDVCDNLFNPGRAIDEFDLGDFELVGYEAHPSIKAPIAV